MARYRVTVARCFITYQSRTIWVDTPDVARAKNIALQCAQPDYISNAPNDDDTGWQTLDDATEYDTLARLPVLVSADLEG